MWPLPASWLALVCSHSGFGVPGRARKHVPMHMCFLSLCIVFDDVPLDKVVSWPSSNGRETDFALHGMGKFSSKSAADLVDLKGHQQQDLWRL